MSTIPRNERRRKSSLLNKARWAGYAAAGAATALGTYEAAEAGITYSGLLNGLDGIKLNAIAEGVGAVGTDFDFDKNGKMDLRMVHSGWSTLSQESNNIYVGAANANPRGNDGVDFAAKIAGTPVGAFYNATRFGKGQLINASPSNFFNFGTMASSTLASCQFNEPIEGWVGFKFDNTEGTHFGWIRVVMDEGPIHSYSIMDWAYAGDGENIRANQVPEPGSLGLLATGGIGLLLWRKRRANRKSA